MRLYFQRALTSNDLGGYVSKEQACHFPNFEGMRLLQPNAPNAKQQDVLYTGYLYMLRELEVAHLERISQAFPTSLQRHSVQPSPSSIQYIQGNDPRFTLTLTGSITGWEHSLDEFLLDDGAKPQKSAPPRRVFSYPFHPYVMKDEPYRFKVSGFGQHVPRVYFSWQNPAPIKLPLIEEIPAVGLFGRVDIPQASSLQNDPFNAIWDAILQLGYTPSGLSFTNGECLSYLPSIPYGEMLKQAHHTLPWEQKISMRILFREPEELHSMLVKTVIEANKQLLKK